MDTTKYKVTLDITREEYRVMHLALDALMLNNRLAIASGVLFSKDFSQQLGREFKQCEYLKKQLMDRFTIAFGRNGTVK